MYNDLIDQIDCSIKQLNWIEQVDQRPKVTKVTFIIQGIQGEYDTNC